MKIKIFTFSENTQISINVNSKFSKFIYQLVFHLKVGHFGSNPAQICENIKRCDDPSSVLIPRGNLWHLEAYPLLIFDWSTFSRRVTAWCWHDQQKIKCRPIRARKLGGISLSGCYMPSTTRYSQRRKAELFHSVNNSTVLCRVVASLTDALLLFIYLFSI